jgi:hypothetical protein
LIKPVRLLTKVIIALLLTAPAAYSVQIWNWTGSFNGYALSGSAEFSVIPDGSQYALQVVITNTATVVPPSTADILTGLYFNITGANGALGMKSATADLGLLDRTHQTPTSAYSAGANICAPKSSTALANVCSSIPGGWQVVYKPGGIGGGAAATQQYGVGTSGQGGVFSGNAANAGNANYGVAPDAGINVALDGLGNMVPYSYKRVTLVLHGLAAASISVEDVAAAYGTAPEATPAAEVYNSTPEPGTWAMIASGIGILCWFRSRRESAQLRTAPLRVRIRSRLENS